MSENVAADAGWDELRRLRAPAGLAGHVLWELRLGLWWSRFETAIGPVIVVHGPEGVVAVRPAGGAGDPAAGPGLDPGRTARPAPEVPARLARRLPAALAGERTGIAVDLRGLSGFARAVLLKTREIPRGEVRTYSWVAREIGRPLAVRAVGTALARNPVPLVIPCHRVVRADWHLGEYSCGGPGAKRSALAAEGVAPAALEALASRGVRFHASDTTAIFCVPTCRHARRTAPGHLVELPSERAAFEAGYRPCRVCRPAAAA